MRIGVDPGPGGTAPHESSHYVYDVRSGAIVSVQHFAGALPKSEPERTAAILKSAHETCGIALEHLAVLTGADVPAGEGELYVEPATRRLVRRPGAADLRVRP